MPSCCWADTIPVSDSDWLIITTPITASARLTSYDTSWETARIEPNSEYLELDDQPPTRNP